MARSPLRPRRPVTGTPRRLAAIGALVAGALVVTCCAAPVADAAGSTTTTTTSPSTTSSTTAPATTSTTAPEATTTTAPAMTSTTPKPTTSTTAPGIPAVPTGGGSSSSSTTAPGAQAPSAAPIIAAVNADLDQLQAIASVTQARQTVATAKADLASANAALTAARVTQSAANQGVQAARGTLNDSVGKLSSIAVAAYTGAAYGTPAAAPSGLPGQPPGDLSTVGTTQQDADELMTLVTQQIKQSLKAAQKQVGAATTVLGQAAGGVDRASTDAQQAAANLTVAQAGLTQTLQGATISGAAFAHQATPATPGAAAATTTPAAATDPNADGSPTILGAPYVSAAELLGWYDTTGHSANTTVPIGQLAADYIAAGKTTGVRGDLAFAQSIIETGYFSFPAGGQLVSTDNNFAGIGACDSCSHGWSFPDALTGVTAQEQLLEAYASPTKVSTPLVGSVGIGGCCQTWMALAGKWATDTQYGISILTVYKRILDYAIPEALVQAGLAPAASAPALPAVPSPTSSPLPAALPATAPATTTAPRAPTLAPAGT